MSAKVQRGICLGLLAIVSAALNLSLSAREGTLAMPPIYDDANYLLDGYLRVLRGDATSLFNLVASIIADPPHAPLSTLTSMLGYSLLGPHVWAPYFVSTWIVLVFLASVVLIAAVVSLAWLLLARRGAPLRSDSTLPFGPGLCLGIWLVWLYGTLS